MKIAVEITIFGHHFNDVVDYPGTPKSQAEVIQWLMSQTEFKWVNYDRSDKEDRLFYHMQNDGVAH